MSLPPDHPTSPPDADPPDPDRPVRTRAIVRGVCRLLRASGLAPLIEVPLADGRRADVVAIGPDGEIVVVEVKSSLADYLADAKWPDYLAWCDRFHFAVDADFPLDILPTDVGVMLADGFGAERLRDDPRPLADTRLPPARRRALLLRLARLAAERLQRAADPDWSGDTG